MNNKQTDSITKMLQTICIQNINKSVLILSEKYGFDITEATEFLNINDSSIVINIKDKQLTKSNNIIDTNKPKKTSGYLLYSAHIRSDTKKELTVDDVIPKPQIVVSAIGAKWKALPEEQRVDWNSKAKLLTKSNKPLSV